MVENNGQESGTVSNHGTSTLFQSKETITITDGLFLPSDQMPIEFRIFLILFAIFLFFLFLIVILWDRYGTEIGKLYTPNINPLRDHQQDGNGKPDEDYRIYRKLPTFFYEYTRVKKK